MQQGKHIVDPLCSPLSVLTAHISARERGQDTRGVGKQRQVLSEFALDFLSAENEIMLLPKGARKALGAA